MKRSGNGMVADTRRWGDNVGARPKGKWVVARKPKAKFDARAFLARVSDGVEPEHGIWCCSPGKQITMFDFS
jgi:hypothetical protein